MRRLLCIFIGCFCLAFPLLAQSNKLIKELESKRGALQKQITESETLLKTTSRAAIFLTGVPMTIAHGLSTPHRYLW